MMKLGLTLPLSSAEPPTSWASRMGRLNGCAYVQDFARDLGLSWPRITRGHSDELRKLSEIASCDLSSIELFAVKPGLGRTRLIGSEPIHSKLMSHQNLKLCPLCIEDSISQDAQLLSGPPVYWQLAPILSCRKHGVALVELPSPEHPRCKYDVAGRVFDHLFDLKQAARVPAQQSCGDLETYIMSRIDSTIGRSPSWLDQLEIGVVSKACTTLLDVLKSKEDLTGQPTKYQSEDHIFNAMRRGRTATKELLEEIWRLPASEKSGFFVDFQRFARWLSQIDDRPGTRPLLDLVRDFVEMHYPVGQGEEVLGRVCKSRKVHSVMTASRQFGIKHLRLRNLFQCISENGGHCGLPPPNTREQVPAEVYSPWLSEYIETLNPKLAARYLGVKYEFFIKLKDSGWIKPFVSMNGLLDRYHPNELQRALDSVLPLARVIATKPSGKISLFASPMHCRCDSLDVLRLACDGELRSIYKLAGRRGLSGLVVSKEEVLDALEGPPFDGFTKDELRWRWRISSSTISHLVNSGLLRSKQIKHPRNRQNMRYVPSAEALRFETEYKTLGCLSEELEIHPIKLASELEKHEILSMNLPRGLSRIYRTSDLKTAL